MALAPKIPFLLITGTTGAGKSSVADEVYELLKAQSQPVALINLDELGYAQPRPADDPFNRQLQLKNLAAIWPNYYGVGTRAVIVPCVVEDQGDVDRLRAAIPGAEVFTVHLDAPLPVLEERIRGRAMGGSASWHLQRATELQAIFERNHLEDLAINTEGKTITSVAEEVITRWSSRQKEASA